MTIALMLGFHGTMAAPADLSGATQALRAAVSARGKKWKRVAPLFSFVRADNALCVGVVLRAAPQSFGVPSHGFYGSPLARVHPVVSTQLRSESVDDHSETIDGLWPALNEIQASLAPLGIRLDEHDPQVPGGERLLLVTTDGAPGVLLHGGMSATQPAAPLQAWSFDYAGESTRFVGYPLAIVDSEHRITALPALSPHERNTEHGDQRRVLDAAGVQSPSLLVLSLSTTTAESAR